MKDQKVEKAKEYKITANCKIFPLKDFIIKQNDFYLEMKAGEMIEVPTRYLENLKTENVIKE